MWGKGLYFAEKSSYSNHFAYRHENGVRGQFFAWVNLGEEAQVQMSDQAREIIKPPDNKDSVKGFTNGSNVYIVYANKQAYP